jgi:hypothetical protein
MRMNRLPGFSAEASLDKADRYRGMARPLGKGVDKGIVPQIWPNPIYGCHVIDGVFFCYPPHLVMPLTYAG